MRFTAQKQLCGNRESVSPTLEHSRALDGEAAVEGEGA
jgi:hypothetical protein